MTVSENPIALAQFRRTPWQFQQTFQTPLAALRPFVEAVVSAHEQVHGGCVTIDRVVFEPKHLIALLTAHSLRAELGSGWSLAGEGQHGAATLLEAALGDWVDFLFVPTPELFAIYADHDEYTTFYAHTSLNLNRIVGALSAKGYTKVSGHERHL